MIATSVEQSKKLLELGLDPQTADMYYHVFSTEVPICEPFDREDLQIPCWSLSALLDLMPEKIESIKETCYFRMYRMENEWAIEYCGSDYSVFMEGKTPIDAAVEMIEWLITNKYLKV